MEWKDVLTKAGQLAPAVGAFFGAPGVAVGTAVSAIIGAFGLKPDAKPDEVIAAIQADPQAALKLSLAKMDYELKQADNRFKEYEAQLKDVQDARDMATEQTKATGKRDINLYVLAWVLILGFFFLMGGLLYFTYNGKTITDSTGVLFMLFGALATSFGAVIQYFFGSSQGSKDKTDLLAKAEPIK